MARYRITHRTTYRYDTTVSASTLLAHLCPRPVPTQQIHACVITALPEPEHRIDGVDAFANPTTYLSIGTPHDQLEVLSTSEVSNDPDPVPTTDVSWEEVRDLTRHDRTPDGLLARACTLDSAFVTRSPALRDYATASFGPARPLVEAVGDLCARIHHEFTFDPEFTDVSTPVDDVLDHRRGVCQDFAHLTIGCLRSLGLGARYVSGYLETDPPPGEPRLHGADASHAWCAVWVPGHGWLDLDPTNDQLPPTRHVTIAWGRDFGDVSPLRGVLLGPATQQRVDAMIDVVPVDQGG